MPSSLGPPSDFAAGLGEDRLPPRKEDRPCCVSKRDALGRLPIGWCGPDCLGRPDVWRRDLLLRREQAS